MKYFYLKEENLKQGYPCVIEAREEQIENYELYFLQQELVVREYVGESLPERLVWDNKLKVVREAIETEKYTLSPETYYLDESVHYIKNGEVKKLPLNETYMVKPYFNVDTEVWEEKATQTEITNYENHLYREFYYKELEDFNKATSEYNAGILTQEEYKECQNYIKFVNSQLNINPKKEMGKPIQMKY